MSIVIIGGGAWGTALACAQAQSSHSGGKGPVTLLLRSSSIYTAMAKTRESPYLPSVRLPDNLHLTLDLKVLQGATLVCFVIPSKNILDAVQFYSPYIKEDVPIVLAAKGFNPIFTSELSLQSPFLAEAVSQLIKNPIGILSGPNFAIEVASCLPAATVISFEKEDTGKYVLSKLIRPLFRVYYSKDRVGVQLGGILKNVYAIAAGICIGAGLGENARSALLTRSLAEMIRFGVSFGAEKETFYGLAGIGDLILTATSHLSRNQSLGQRIGMEGSSNQVLSDVSLTTEGINTAKLLHSLSKEKNIYMPIASEVYAILFQGKKVVDGTLSLLSHRESVDE